MENPQNVTVFESQAVGEQVIFVQRAHFIKNLSWMIVAFLLALVPWVVSVLNVFETANLAISLPQASIEGFVLIWYLVVFAYILQNLLHWYFNVYILTDKRVVDIDFTQLLYKQVSSTHLENVEDVTASMGGVAQALFHYGDVRIQTAGTNPNFEFIGIAKPGDIKKQIDQQIQARKQ